MTAILALFTEYLKPILVGLASVIGFLLISRNTTLKAENQMLNDSMEDENKTVEAQNEALEAVNNTTPADINGVTDLMREGKL